MKAKKETKAKLVIRSIALPKGHFDAIKKSAEKNGRTFLGEVRYIVKEWFESKK